MRDAVSCVADDVTIREATTAADIAAVRDLCWAYRDFLLNSSGTDRDITETFYPEPKYRTLMDNIAQEHARPKGLILLAMMDGEPIGCGMSHEIAPQTAEIKRVFVTDAARGQGIAARLCTDLMDQARADSYTRMVLDTSRSLTSAQRLYARLGFTPCGPYQDIPAAALPHLLFYEITL